VPPLSASGNRSHRHDHDRPLKVTIQTSVRTCLDFVGGRRYNSYISSIEQMFADEREHAMALAATLAPADSVAPAARVSPQESPAYDAPAVEPGRRRGSRAATPRRPKLGPVGQSHHRASETTPYRLTRRGRVLTWVAGVVTLGIIAFGLAQGAQPATPTVVGTTTVTVAPGQTLWAVAQQVNPQADPRVTVQAIADVNGIEAGSALPSGSTLTVPVFSSAR
jgi:hypothetical protein